MKKGQVLARLDRTPARRPARRERRRDKRADAAIEQAKSLIAQSEAQLSSASGDYDRAQKLGRRHVAGSTIEQRETTMKTAQAQLDSAQQRARASPKPTARRATPSGRS